MHVLLTLIERYGLLAVPPLLILLFLRILLDEDRSSLWRAKLFKALFALTGRVEHEKKFIGNDLRGRINLARRRLHARHSILPVAVDVCWVEGAEGEALDIADGEFVIRLDPSSHQERNISLLALAVVRRTTLQGIRHSVDTSLALAIDFNLVRKLLLQIDNRAGLDWFLGHDYQPTLERDAATRHRNDQVTALDERGLFTQILLTELDDFASRMRGLPPRPYMVGEIDGLVEFLYTIATKPPGERVPLYYRKAFIRVSVIIVAKTSTLLQSIEPYVEAMQIHLERSSRSIYVLAFDKEWLGESDPSAERRFGEQVEALESGLRTLTVATKDFDITYYCVDQSGRRRRARCIRFLAQGESPEDAA
jgi:hypothetical protein